MFPNRTAEIREKGGITPILGVIAIILAVVALGGITIGKIVAVRADAQRAADAAAMVELACAAAAFVVAMVDLADAANLADRQRADKCEHGRSGWLEVVLAVRFI